MGHFPFRFIKTISTSIQNLRAECKKKLDTLGITRENVGSISEYASDMYIIGKYDEVEAEYSILKILRR
nr:MAG TPA: hypothetical protein [Caudoviricetes sp.]